MMPHRTKLAFILLVETLLFALASLVHAGVLASGFEHGRAMIAEGVIAAVLGLGLLALLTCPARGPFIALAAQGFALLGTLVGAFTIAVGVGPQTRGDSVFHVVLLVVLLAGIHTAWRWRRH
ncbi:hypothetical protein AB6806_19630 [Bosea sp. RCC_152_1]|uniref:hypothetical protein n=1 Tax=Bosea sp. RCC_152_1 TaxID=3239228 RepID=UPI003524E5B0